MIKKLITVLMILMLLFPASAALAEEDGASAAALAVDTQHVYPGMDKSYALGYMPTVADGTATVMLPLTVSVGMCDTVSASLDLGDPSAAPFVFKNYVSDFAWNTYTVAEGSASCCLVRFDLALRQDRMNGSFPVTVRASGKTREGAAVAGEFTLYVVITDGKSAAVETSHEPAPVPQPKLMVEGYACSTEPLEAGAQATLSVIVRNTSTTQTVKNIKLSFQDESGEILPASTGSLFIARIKKGEVETCGFDIRVAENASARAHLLTVTMEYENSAATAFSSSDTIVLDVTQPMRLEYEQPALPGKVTEGDNVAFSMNVMNLGKGTVYNVLLTFEIPGLNNGGSVLVGNIQPGEAKKAATNLRVSPVDGEYGDTSGSVLLSYEDEAGKKFEQDIPMQTRIEKKIAPVSAEVKETARKDEAVIPWWGWCAGGFAVSGLAVLIIVKTMKSKRQREMDEKEL